MARPQRRQRPRGGRHQSQRSSTPHRCSTFLKNGAAGCNKWITSLKRCDEHQIEYIGLTKEYKRHAELADLLETSASIPLQAIDLLQNSEEAQQRLRAVDEFIEAISSEIQERKTHHRRFFENIDRGHAEYIKIREERMTTAVTIRTVLDAKRNALLQAESRSSLRAVVDGKKNITTGPTPSKYWSSAEPTTPKPIHDAQPRRATQYSYRSQLQNHHIQPQPPPISPRPTPLKTSNGHTYHSDRVTRPPVSEIPLSPMGINANTNTQSTSHSYRYSTSGPSIAPPHGATLLFDSYGNFHSISRPRRRSWLGSIWHWIVNLQCWTMPLA
ncbi:hypothetical protein QCA50_015213 [Cerrena zonata]|uniref:Uncharacterized protein n=1 Tax=Cerrena zonata TaxID=2478898 RepID=A0AAW0FYK7_9APHY